jgi:ribosome recycling factor
MIGLRVSCSVCYLRLAALNLTFLAATIHNRELSTHAIQHLSKTKTKTCKGYIMDADEILLDAEERMEKAVTVFTEQLTGLRTGRATPGLVDSIRIDYYGSQTPLKQVANITVPEPQQILIRPFDAGTMNEIVKAIQSSDVGLAPMSDGRVIRLNVPPLSRERRQQLVSRTKEFAEDSRVSVRNIRRDANKHADNAEKDKSMSEDQRDTTKDEVQTLTKKFEGMINSAAAEKEKQVMDE